MLEKITKNIQTGETNQKNWYTDRYQSVLVQRNLLAIFSLIALVFSTIAIFLVYTNIPIVTVEPFVIQIEPKSGITQVVTPQTTQQIAAQKSINDYFIYRYIQARENVDSALPYHYEVVRLMSDPRVVFPEYRWSVNPNNPDSFIARSGGAQGGMERRVKIKSMQRRDNNYSCSNGVVCEAQIRVTITEGPPQAQKLFHNIILMQYTFTEVNLTLSERYINPVGFRVLSYRVDPEVIQ